MPTIRLEPFTAAHLDAFRPLTADPDVLRFTRFPDPPEPRFPEMWLARYDEGRANRTKEAFAILGEDGAFLGVALAVEIDREAAEAELGYLTAPAARGRGVATEAVRQLTRWALEGEGLERVTLLIDAANGGSRKVAERAGYTLDGILRNAYVKPGVRTDTYVYSCLRSELSGAPQADRSAGGGTL
jgi:RimJ/RimL family protein N-acetyltransferase